jgi:metallophosphoesterase (TIGR00282 family)
MKVLLIGDIVGRAGRRAVRELLPDIKKDENIDFIIANGENAAGGFGITGKVAEELYGYGIDVLTMGNHTWDNKEIFNFIEDDPNLIRPYNYPPGTPGRGYNIYKLDSGVKLAVVNLLGRIFLADVDCPFQALEKLLEELEADLVFVDFHAEATSEKKAFGWHFAKKVSAVLGTHTHVQTADETILLNHTAYITDVGMTGPVNSILGVQKEAVINKFISGLPAKFEVSNNSAQINAVVIDINDNGIAKSIKRIQKFEK